MRWGSKSLVCVSLSCGLLIASEHSIQAQSSSSVVAYVYVANAAGGNSMEISAFTANEAGRLEPIQGSPFMEDVGYMVVNGGHLMAAAGSNINAYKIEKGGALSFEVATNYQVPQPGCGAANQMIFDHTGQSLYITEYDVDCSNNGITNWSVDQPTGGLNYLGLTDTGTWNVNAAYFIGNNQFAYTAYNDNCMYYSMNGFQRSASGALTEFSPSMNVPTPPAGVRAFIPYLGAADPTNHVAFAEYPANPPGCAANPVQLATYTVGSNGSLTTTSTAANMPVSKVESIYDMQMAPSGKLLAVAGQEGLQVFHFNGSSPITHFTGLLTSEPISQMFWDNANHLYAITGVFNSNVNHLHVFTVTPTGYHEAPQSPYTIEGPRYLIVQPLTNAQAVQQ